MVFADADDGLPSMNTPVNRESSLLDTSKSRLWCMRFCLYIPCFKKSKEMMGKGSKGMDLGKGKQ